jgi:hypothetical protein
MVKSQLRTNFTSHANRVIACFPWAAQVVHCLHGYGYNLAGAKIPVTSIDSDVIPVSASVHLVTERHKTAQTVGRTSTPRTQSERWSRYERHRSYTPDHESTISSMGQWISTSNGRRFAKLTSGELIDVGNVSALIV